MRPDGPGPMPGGVPLLHKGPQLRQFRVIIEGRTDGSLYQIAGIKCQGITLLEMRTILGDLVESSKPTGVVPTVPPEEKPTNGHQPPAGGGGAT